MNENQYSKYMLTVMKNINLITVLYISMIIARCLKGYVRENSALDFLNRINTLPPAAWKIPVCAIGLFLCFLLLLWIRSESTIGLFLKICLELGIAFFISYIIGFSYTGLILLILADAMRYFPGSKWKIPIAVFISMFYLLGDINILVLFFETTSFETYLEYFQSDARFMLLGIKNVLASLNTLVFLVYMIFMVRTQYSEKERILSLNEKLNETNDELKQANVQLEEYARESVKAAEAKERNRLAREIHDTLGHALTGIITGIEACTTLMDVAPEATKEQLRAIAEVARQGVTDVRRSVKALRPDVLERLDLEKALEAAIEEIHSATNAEIIYRCETKLNCFSEDEEDIIYRIVQECITNSIRHGKADRIEIYIKREYNILKLYIKDNGIGCADVKKGFGLHHMAERLEMLRGKLSYDGTNGFTVDAQIPIRWGTEETDHD